MRRIHPLQISLSMTITLMTLIDPDVEAAQPPINIMVISIIWHEVGQDI